MKDERDPLADLHVGTGTLARLLGLSRQRVGQLVEVGILQKRGRGRFPVEASVQAYLGFLRDQAGDGAAGATDYGVQRVRLLKLKADLAAMQLAREQRDVIPIATVVDEMTSQYAAVRAHLLALPSKLAPHLEQVAARQAFDVLTRGVREALQELVDQAEAELRALETDQ